MNCTHLCWRNANCSDEPWTSSCRCKFYHFSCVNYSWKLLKIISFIVFVNCNNLTQLNFEMVLFVFVFISYIVFVNCNNSTILNFDMFSVCVFCLFFVLFCFVFFFACYSLWKTRNNYWFVISFYNSLKQYYFKNTMILQNYNFPFKLSIRFKNYLYLFFALFSNYRQLDMSCSEGSKWSI